MYWCSFRSKSCPIVPRLGTRCWSPVNRTIQRERNRRTRKRYSHRIRDNAACSMDCRRWSRVECWRTRRRSTSVPRRWSRCSRSRRRMRLRPLRIRFLPKEHTSMLNVWTKHSLPLNALPYLFIHTRNTFFFVLSTWKLNCALTYNTVLYTLANQLPTTRSIFVVCKFDFWV